MMAAAASPHILFVTGEYPPVVGGVGAYTAELARALVEAGNEVSVYTARAATPRDPAPGVVAVYPLAHSWRLSMWREVAGLAAHIGADWIHVQYQTAAFHMNPAINLAPYYWRREFRVAWTYHDLLYPYLFPKAGRRLRRWVTERPARAGALTLVTNHGDRLALLRRAITAHVAPIGSNVRGVELSAEERTALRSKLGYAGDDLVLGYFGFLNRSKGGLTVVRTLRELVDRGLNAHLLLIGDTTGASDPTNRAYLAQVEALIETLGLQTHVRWTGRLEDQAASAHLNAIDVLLLPYEDGASLRRGTLMAGLANGCAIVTTTPVEEIEELAHRRDALFVPPGEPVAAADAVQSLVDDPDLAERLRERARALSAQFDWDRIAERHLELYAQSRQG